MADYVEESRIDSDINTNIDRDKWDGDQVLNQVAVDVNGDGTPDALAVCNPDGTPMNESQGMYYTDDELGDEIPQQPTFLLLEFGFKAKTISATNDSTIASRCFGISFDGVNIQARLCGGESFTWENIGVNRIWVTKTAAQAVPYRVFAY